MDHQDHRSTRKNILFLIPSLYGGGAERVCCILANAFSESCNVTIGYLCDREKTYHIESAVNLVKIPWTGGYYTRWCTTERIRGFYKSLRFVRKLKKELNIDYTISMLLSASLLNVLARSRGRIVTYEQCSPARMPAWMRRMTGLVYAFSDLTVFQSESARDQYGRAVRRHAHIVQNPIIVRCTAAQERRHRIVTMGRLNFQKNHALLIRSFYRFHQDHPGYELSIYGEGELREKLAGQIAKLGLTDYVFLEGNRENVHECIQDAEIFVLSSNFEGLSNALLEAMTMGIACISTACEGSTDVIRNGENGLLTRTGDETELADAMEKLAEDPEFRRKLESNAVQDAAAFSIERVIAKWENFLDMQAI